MRHANAEDLEGIADLITSLRATELREKAPGVFYRRSKAFLHFHADPTGIFADVRTEPDAEFVRVRATSKVEQRRLLTSVRRALASSPAPETLLASSRCGSWSSAPVSAGLELASILSDGAR